MFMMVESLLRALRHERDRWIEKGLDEDSPTAGVPVSTGSFEDTYEGPRIWDAYRELNAGREFRS